MYISVLMKSNYNISKLHYVNKIRIIVLYIILELIIANIHLQFYKSDKIKNSFGI